MSQRGGVDHRPDRPPAVHRRLHRNRLAGVRPRDLCGALNIYARTANAFDDVARGAAAHFGPNAAVAVGNVHAYESAQDTAHDLQVALESRAVIDQAKGIVTERHRMTADQAFQLLAGLSSRTNTKLREVAERLVHTGELPDLLDR